MGRIKNYYWDQLMEMRQQQEPTEEDMKASLVSTTQATAQVPKFKFSKGASYPKAVESTVVPF